MPQAATPDVSIIVPCFNASRTLAEALDSALGQEGPSFEIIVVDDGSTDTSVALIERYRARYPDLVRAEYGPNRGVAHARNRGSALARGRYLLFLDADDWLRAGTVRARFDALEATGDEIAYTDWQEMVERADGTRRPGMVTTHAWQSLDDDPEVAIVRGFWAPPAALLYRRTCVERTGGFDPSLHHVEDGRFMFHAVHGGARMRHVPGLGADYRRAHARTSESRRDPGGLWRNMVAYAAEVEGIWQQCGGLTPPRQRALLVFLGKAARQLYVHDPVAFRAVLQKLAALDPRYIPHERPSMRIIAHVIGYPRSEAVARIARSLLRPLRAKR